MLGWIAWDALSFGSDACLDFSLPCRMNTRSLLSAWAALLVVTVRHRGQYCSQKTSPSPWSECNSKHSVSPGLEGWENG